MKFTSKKSVSEVVIDFEDGCVLKLTKGNCCITEIRYVQDHFGRSNEFYVEMLSGLSFQLRVVNAELSKDLHNLRNL